jgi:hypothetical protein
MTEGTVAGREGDVEADEPTDRPDHLADLADGSGCAEVWEHLSETREE